MSGWEVLFAVVAFLGQLLTEIARGLWAITKFLGWVLIVTLAVVLCTGRTGRTGRRLEYRTRPE